ncbi:hypothetical protein BDV93DRAFT_608906 [Ceratobasidium sp. AG-I]|nr:hypothetical protein BDV93DRAFT_608906 [Ceratobasidium sp. AG-I]
MADQSALDTLRDTLRPPAPSPLFTGRTKELEFLDSFFWGKTERELALIGVSGSGKTQLALRFVQRMMGDWDIVYLDVVSTSQVLPGLFDELQGEPIEPALLHPDPHPRTGLVIFDGLIPPRLFDPSHRRSSRDYMRRVLGYRELWILYILSSQPSVLKAPHDKYRLNRGLDREAATTLLVNSMEPKHGDSSSEDKETASQIVECFGCFAREIVQVGKAIQDSETPLQAYRLMSAAQRKKWISEIRASLDAPWSSYYETLSTSEQILLRLLVFLKIDELDLLKEILTRARANLATYQPLILTQNEVDQTKTDVSELVSRFTSRASGSIECNPTFHEVAMNLENRFMFQFGGGGHHWSPEAYTWAKSLVEHPPFVTVAAYLLASSIGPELDNEVEHCLFRSQLASIVENMLLSYPDACVYHSRAFSLVYEAGNRWEKVIGFQKSILSKCTLELGRTHPNTVSVSKSLMGTYCSIGRWGDAMQLLSTLLSYQKDALGEQHLETMSTMHALALTLPHMDRWGDAESLLERVRDGRIQVLSESHHDTLSAMHSLASVYFEQGRWRESQELLEQVLEARRRVLGEHHPDTLLSMHNLATKHPEARQSLVNAEELNDQVLEARKRLLGLEHSDTLLSMFALALVYRRRGQRRDAVDLAESVLEAQKRCWDAITSKQSRPCAPWRPESRKAVYGNDDPETLASMGELVLNYWKQGLWEQAENLHVELLGARERVLGKNDPAYLATSLNLATHYISQCRWQEASVILRQVLEIKMQDQELERNDPEIEDIQQQLDSTLAALSLDAFVISPAVPMESVVTYFTEKAGLEDYSARLQEAPDLPTTAIDGGGFADIYRVTLRDGRILAVKCLRNAQGEYKQVKRTTRELSIWSQLQHKGIVPLLGLALFRGQLAMVLPWNEKGNVMKYIKQQPDLDRYVLCTQVVGAVVYLHKSDVIHGDLKGVNILVSDDGTLQLADFGLAIIQNTSIKFSASTNLISGTCRWMAPELLLEDELADDTELASPALSEAPAIVGENEDDPQAKLCRETDVYALGMTMLVRRATDRQATVQRDQKRHSSHCRPEPRQTTQSSEKDPGSVSTRNSVLGDLREVLGADAGG